MKHRSSWGKLWKGWPGYGLALLLLGACGNLDPTPVSNSTATVPATVAKAVPTTISATLASTTMVAAATTEAVPTETVVPSGYFQNPVFKTNFPDPYVLKAGNLYYAYATNSGGHNIQVATSKDLVHWELQNDALPALPAWAKLDNSLVWAPEVIQIGDKFVMYYTAHDKASDRQCVGVATASLPEGIFKDNNAQPLICQAGEGGTIDPDVFQDGSKLYLYFKNDGNCCAIDARLYAQELTPDGQKLLGTPAKLISADQSWEGIVVEAPSMVKHDGTYFLFFSGNSYNNWDYAVGYATCKSPLGPCEQAPENPILKTVLNNPPVFGPGHQTVLQMGDETWLFYHAWEISSEGIKTDRRFMWLDRLEWSGGKPKVLGPSTVPQPAPKIKP